MQDIRKKSLSLLTALLLVLSLFTLLPEGSFRADAAVTKYELWIAGTQITSENLSSDGFVYDPDTNILTSENSVSSIWSTTNPVIEHSIPGLNIKVDDAKVLSSETKAGILCHANTRITGRGRLTLKSTSDAALLIDSGTLSIEISQLIAEGKWGISGMPKDEKLIINNSFVSVSSNEGEFAIGDFKNGISLVDSAISSPEGGTVKKFSKDGTDSYSIVGSDGKTPAEKVYIFPEPTKDGIFFDDARVTEDNASDILGGGEASYDFATKTLTLKKSLAAVISIRTNGVTVKVDNEVYITNPNTDAEKFSFYIYNDTAITGSGKLHASFSVSENTTLTFYKTNIDSRDDAAHRITGSVCGSRGRGFGSRLVINESTFEGHFINEEFYEFDELVLESAAIETPEDAWLARNNVIIGSTPYTGDVKIVPYVIYPIIINNDYVTTKNKDYLADGAARFDEKTNTLYIVKPIEYRSGNAGMITTSLYGITINDRTPEDVRTADTITVEAGAKATFTGIGVINANINAEKGATVILNNTTYKLNSYGGTIKGITKGENAAKLLINNSTVEVESYNGAIRGFDKIEVTGCKIITPSNAKIKDGAICDSDGNLAKRVVISNSSNLVTVRYHSNGGTGSMPEEQYIKGSSFTVPWSRFTAPENCGFYWWTDGNGEIVRQTSVIENLDKDLDLYAVWVKRYDVNFYNTPDEVTIRQQVWENSNFDFPRRKTWETGFPAPYEGYIVTGFMDQNGNIYAPEEIITIKSDMDFYVLWGPGIRIAGTEVTTYNQNNILGNGTAKFYRDSVTGKPVLEINKNIEGQLENYACDDLTIKFTAPVTINSTAHAVKLSKNTTILSDFTVSITSRMGAAITFTTDSEATLTIRNANLALSGKLGINGITAVNAAVHIEDATVSIASTQAAVNGLTMFDLMGCEIVSPTGAVIVENEIRESNKTTVVKNAVITPVEYYDLTVGEQKVSSVNSDDILGGGEASFDPVSRTLTLKKDVGSIVSGIVDLTIKAQNNVTVGGDLGKGNITLNASTTITGPGKITVARGDVWNMGIVIKASEPMTLKLTNANIELSGSAYLGIKGYVYYGTAGSVELIVNHSTVKVWDLGANAPCAVGGFNKITLIDAELSEPYGTFTVYGSENINGSIYNYGGTQLAKNVYIVPLTTYGLYINNIQANERNCGDILGGGEASYDPSSNTLTLHKDISGFIWNRSISGMKLTSDKDVTVSNSENYYALRVGADTTVTGKHKLTFNADCAISIINSAALSIEDTEVIARGKWGIQGLTQGEALKIVNSKVSASGSIFAVGDLGKTIELTGCSFVEPEDAIVGYTFVSSGISYMVCCSDGITEAKEVIIEPAHLFLRGDVNLSGSITADDAIIVARLAAGYGDYATRYNSEIADMNCDGKVTADDAIIIARYAAGYGNYREIYTSYL